MKNPAPLLELPSPQRINSLPTNYCHMLTEKLQLPSNIFFNFHLLQGTDLGYLTLNALSASWNYDPLTS